MAGKRNVLEEIKSDVFTERQKKAVIFGAIYGLAEYVCKDNAKLLGLYPEYCATPGKIFDKILLYVNCERRPPRIERRLDELIWQLTPEDLGLAFDFSEEQGGIGNEVFYVEAKVRSYNFRRRGTTSPPFRRHKRNHDVTNVDFKPLNTVIAT